MEILPKLALRWANKIRRKRGDEPRSALVLGHQGRAGDCVMARTVGEARFAPKEHPDKWWDEREDRARHIPIWLQIFIYRFDKGVYDLYDEPYTEQKAKQWSKKDDLAFQAYCKQPDWETEEEAQAALPQGQTQLHAVRS